MAGCEIYLEVVEEIFELLEVCEKGDPGTPAVPVDHNDLTAIQGGTVTERYHLTAAASAGPTQAEAEAGTSTVLKLWSALRVWQAIKSAWLSITAQGWTVEALGTVGAALTMNAATFSEFTATLPAAGTTTTISISNLPATPTAWPVLHLITGATFDAPIWSGIDATDITLVADTTHNIGFEPMRTTSGWVIVAVLLVTRPDA